MLFQFIVPNQFHFRALFQNRRVLLFLIVESRRNLGQPAFQVLESRGFLPLERRGFLLFRLDGRFFDIAAEMQPHSLGSGKRVQFKFR